MTMPSDKSVASWRDIPTSVWALGAVSLLMDISSELIHSLLPAFLITVIGASTIEVGLIQGISEATAAIAKVFSGALSDRLGKRKLLAGIGYGLGALAKPIFPLASTTTDIFLARFIDRVGKGIRGAPRDALIADITPREIRGAAYGVRQALDTVGGFVGPLMAMLAMVIYANDFRAVFWWATVPAALCVLLLVFGVQEPDCVKRTGQRGWPVKKADLARLPSRYWLVVGIGILCTLARFSEAFLVIKAQGDGLALALLPLVFIWMNIVYAAIAAPAGVLSDRIGCPRVLLAGLCSLIVADLALAFVPGLTGTFIGVGFWGAYLGMTQGLLAALVADAAPDDLRGTAFGLFNLVTGGALLIASVLAGWLWHVFGPMASFIAGAAFASVAAVLIATSMSTGTESGEGRGNATPP